MSYRSGTRGEHLTSKGYLEYLDQRLGFPRGTLYGLCLATTKSKTKTKTIPGVKVTYRGETERQGRRTHRFIQERKGILPRESQVTKAGKQIDQIVQAHLEE